MAEYTPIRQFYAWVGFTLIATSLLLGIAAFGFFAAQSCGFTT